jgi:elongation factor G
LEGVCDLINMKAIYFDGDNGEVVRVEEIPADLQDLCKEKKLELIGALAENDEGMEEFFLEENIDIPVD